MEPNVTNKINQSNNIPKIPNSIIYTGKFLQCISSKLATRFAVKLFKTPIKFKTPKREKLMAKSSNSEMHFVPELNKEVMVYTYGYSKRKVLLVHGWSGRGTQLYKIADKLLENGFMTYSFDAPAHGKSQGKETMMPEFMAVSKYLEDKYGPFEIAIGHSLGGMSVLNSIKNGMKFKKAITIGAGDIITDIIKVFISKIEMNPKFVEKMKFYFFKKFGDHIDNYSASLAAQNVSIPTLVIHDSDDKEVPVSCAYNIRTKLKNGELLITNDLGHTRILKDPTVVNRVIDFVLRDH